MVESRGRACEGGGWGGLGGRETPPTPHRLIGWFQRHCRWPATVAGSFEQGCVEPRVPWPLLRAHARMSATTPGARRTHRGSPGMLLRIIAVCRCLSASACGRWWRLHQKGEGRRAGHWIDDHGGGGAMQIGVTPCSQGAWRRDKDQDWLLRTTGTLVKPSGLCSQPHEGHRGGDGGGSPGSLPAVSFACNV